MHFTAKPSLFGNMQHLKRGRLLNTDNMPCQQSRCGLDSPELTRVGVGSCSYDSDLQQPAVMSPLGEVDWRWGGQRGMKG